MNIPALTLLSALTLSPLLLSSSMLLAQDTSTVSGPVLNNEGIDGNVDKKHRGPALSVGTHRDIIPGTPGQVRILADAVIPNDGYAKYPIRVDFFVNRELVSSQLRTLALPGALGVTLPLSKYPLPFNYQVLATTVFPNGSHATLIEGAVTDEGFSPAATMDCTLSQPSASASPTPSPSASPTETSDAADSPTYVANGVSSTQNGDAYSIKFTASSAESGSSLEAEVSLTIGSDQTTATLTTKDADGNTVTTSMSGTAQSSNGSLTSVEISSEDGETTLSCS